MGQMIPEKLFKNVSGSGGGFCSLIARNESLHLCADSLPGSQQVDKVLDWDLLKEFCSSLADSVTANDSDPASIRPGSAEVWGYSILCVSIINLTSVLGVAILPFMTKVFYSRLLSALIGLAVGSLSGSAVFHLIPSAFKLAESSLHPHHSYLNTSLTVLLGMYLFFLIERLLKMMMDWRSRRRQADHQANLVLVGQSHHQTEQASLVQSPLDAINISGKGSTPATRIATVAWMIIFGDGIHNFIDGISIGAAFSESVLTGISVSVAVLCEELPHELGDFAVLLSSGMSVREALVYNFMSACTCYLGLVLGIFLGELDSNSYIFALAGGMFLYIALVDMVPEMNETVEKSSKISLKAALSVFALQNVGILCGIVSLYLLAKYQDDIVISF